MTEFEIIEEVNKKMISTFDKSKSGAILGVIGCGNLMYTAAVATVNGDNFQKKSNTDSLYNFESAGRTLCGVTVDTFSTPAGSFFVPTVESWGKSQDLINRRLELCNTVLHTATDNRSSLLVQSSSCGSGSRSVSLLRFPCDTFRTHAGGVIPPRGTANKGVSCGPYR